MKRGVQPCLMITLLVVGCGSDLKAARDLDLPPDTCAAPATLPLTIVPEGEVIIEPGHAEVFGRSFEVNHRLAVGKSELMVDGLDEEELRAVRRKWPLDLCRVDEENYYTPKAEFDAGKSFSWYEAAMEANRRSRLAGLEECYRIDAIEPCDSPGPCARRVTLGAQCMGFRLPTSDEWTWLALADGAVDGEAAWSCLTGDGGCAPAPRLLNLHDGVSEWVETAGRVDRMDSQDVNFAATRGRTDSDVPFEDPILADQVPTNCGLLGPNTTGARLVRTLPPAECRQVLRLGDPPPAESTAHCPSAPEGWFVVAPGTRRLGDGIKHRSVRDYTINEGLWVSLTEVSSAEWSRTPPPPDHELHIGVSPPLLGPTPDHPVRRVPFALALLYANERSRAEGLPVCYMVGPCPPGSLEACPTTNILPDCRGYRLLTLDEWVVAAHQLGARAFGRDRREGAWLPGCGTSAGDEPDCRPRPVGQPAVLHDFLGNVNELVWEADEASRQPLYGEPRGGGLAMPFLWASIYRRSSSGYYADVGLRLARTVSCEPKP